MDFWAFRKTAAPKALSPSEADMYAHKQNSIIIDAVAVILGHEIGHLALEHKRYDQISPAESRKQEYAADKYGADLARKAGFRVIASYFFFVRFAAAEELSSTKPNTHPSAICRAKKILIPEFERILAGTDAESKQARADFQKNGSGKSMYEGLKDLKKIGTNC